MQVLKKCLAEADDNYKKKKSKRKEVLLTWKMPKLERNILEPLLSCFTKLGFILFYYTKQINSIFPCVSVCSVIDHRRRQNMVRTQKWPMSRRRDVP